MPATRCSPRGWARSPTRPGRSTSPCTRSARLRLRLADPAAVAAAEHDAMAGAGRADLEDGLVLLGARPADDLDQLQLLGLGAELLGRDPACGGLEVRAVPAAVAGRRRGEVVIDLRERAVEGRPRAGELAVAGDDPADHEDHEHDQDDDQPKGHERSMSGSGRNGTRCEMRAALALAPLQALAPRLAVTAQPLADRRVGMAVEVEREAPRLEV